ncbi:MAG: SseB family protein, partial [Clostridiales bacterium]|nr:SseB family protein [Clostridiales bacterium]
MTDNMKPMNEEGYTEQMLQDGSTLVYLKHRFMEKKTKEQLDWIYSCIRDSKLIVPLIPISKKPDMLEDDDGIKYLAIFSQEEQMPEDYRDEF